jgi:flavin reductase (DIM6/NTAB) family NADH-FMN oxidoreductase RutF
MIIDKEALQDYESRYRATLINSLAGIRQAFLVGSRSKEGLTNLAIFSSLIHLGANPPLWGFISRPDTVGRDTLRNILETKSYTINYVSDSYFEKAHQTSAKYDKEVSEFEACGFTAEYHAHVKAPFVAEAHVKVAMKLEQKIDIALNGTVLLIGSIEHIELNETLVAEDGFVALDQASTLACAGLDAYYLTTLIDRLAYPRPFQSARRLPD